MTNRFHGFPVRLATLSRFSTAAEQKADRRTAGRRRAGRGHRTHRLLGKDVSFKNLGLLVVDEEQRFGVKHKESIKQMKKNVDVLTLSATPIPRTLHMSMVGIRICRCSRPRPPKRYPVQTYVVEYSDSLVRDAILREIARGGQVYVLHNRVQTIEAMFARLKKLVPEAKIAIGHGQKREQALEDVMAGLLRGQVRRAPVYPTSSRRGWTCPRQHADRLRPRTGSVSRSYTSSAGASAGATSWPYAFLTVAPTRCSPRARQAPLRHPGVHRVRLRLPGRDAGLGDPAAPATSWARSVGPHGSVGYDLYVKMIEEAVRELRGDQALGDIQTKMELKVDAFLPGEYVKNEHDPRRGVQEDRLGGQPRGAGDLFEELIDRFGDPARPVMNLIEIAHLKNLCQKLGIDLVTGRSVRW
jgi:transcription-repair coupling factor (superfamily II helicase)